MSIRITNQDMEWTYHGLCKMENQKGFEFLMTLLGHWIMKLTLYLAFSVIYPNALPDSCKLKTLPVTKVF